MKPEGSSSTPEEEKAYRRGFDQGLYMGLRLAGISDQTIHRLPYKERISRWRYGRAKLSALPIQYLARFLPSQSG
jgi:hypothetical protein